MALIRDGLGTKKKLLQILQANKNKWIKIKDLGGSLSECDQEILQLRKMFPIRKRISGTGKNRYAEVCYEEKIC